MTVSVCCKCQSTECETRSPENNDRLRNLVEQHQKGVKFCSCIQCVHTTEFNVQHGDRMYCCGCYIQNVVKCPLYYLNSQKIFANAWSFELKKRKVYRKTLPLQLPEYFFTAFFETSRKGYVLFNDKKHLNDVIEWLNTLYGIEYTHDTISNDSIKSCLPLTINEFSHARHIWYKSNK